MEILPFVLRIAIALVQFNRDVACLVARAQVSKRGGPSAIACAQITVILQAQQLHCYRRQIRMRGEYAWYVVASQSQAGRDMQMRLVHASPRIGSVFWVQPGPFPAVLFFSLCWRCA